MSYRDLIEQDMAAEVASRSAAVGDIDASPDDAQRALELGEATGVNPSVVYGDLENFERETKSRFAGEIISRNPKLSDYVARNPMASRLSNDDYGQLDTVSQNVDRFTPQSALDRVFKAFKAGFDLDGLKKEYSELGDVLGKAGGFVADKPILAPAAAALAASAAFPAGAIASFDVMARSFNAGSYAVAAGAGEIARLGGENEAEADRLVRDIIQGIQVNTAGVHIARAPLAPEFKQMARVAAKTEPWLIEGREPPAFVDPVIDRLKVQQNTADVKALDEALRESDKSSTRGRNADMFASFIRQHTDAKIGVSGDAVQRLYGDKLPTPDDGILGWVPGIADQLEAAVATGGDIQIPIADWLARVDPKLAKDLRDDIRVRPGNITKADQDAVKAAEEGLEPEAKLDPMFPIDTMRDAAALEPLFQLNDRKLKLSRVETRSVVDESAHDFEFLNEKGEPVGYLVLSEQGDGKVLYVEDVAATQGMRGDMAHVFGPRLIRDILMQIKEQFPNATELRGHRVSGARDKAGTWESHGMAGIKLQVADMPHAVKALYEERKAWADKNAIELTDDMFLNIVSTRIGQLERDITAHNKVAPDEPHAGREQLKQLRTWRRRGGGSIQMQAFDETVDWAKGWAEITDDSRWRQTGASRVEIPTPEEIVGKEREVANAITEELNKIVPKGVVHSPVIGIQSSSGNRTTGLYQGFEIGKSLLYWSLASDDPRMTARHEAIHHLRQQGFFTNEEWTQLRRTAVDQGWLEKYGIESRYEGMSRAGQLEEAIAEAFGDWRSGKLPAEGAIAKLFERIKELLENIRYRVKEIVGRELTADDIFAAVERGQVGGREGGVSRVGEAEQRPPIQLELGGDALTRMEDRPPFKTASAMGLTEAQHKRYMKLIEARNAEDVSRATDKATREERRRQSDEWKALEAPIREAVVREIDLRPDVMAINAFRHGEVFGKKMPSVPKLDPALLTEDQRKALPERWQSAEDGLNPSEFAPFFGYQDGASMVDGMVQYYLEEVASAKRPIEFKRQLIQEEVTRRMERQHGRLADNILEEVKDRVLSETQLDLLHEETMALAPTEAELSITKDQMKAWATDQLHKQNLWSLSSDKLLAQAGKAGKIAENALLKGDAATAFREKQRQFINVVMAKEASRVEKEYGKFERVAKRFSQREVSGVNQEFTDYIQALLLQAEIPGRRSLPELQEAIGRHGYKSLDDFVSSQAARGWDPAVSPEILASGVKALDSMSVAEFLDFKTSLDSLAHIGRAVNQIEVGTRKMEFEALKTEVLNNVRSLPLRKPNSKNFFYWADASLVRMEQVIKDLDLRKELGPLFNSVIRPVQDAKAQEHVMQKRLEARLLEIAKKPEFQRKWQKTLNDTIPQDFLIDPLSGAPFDLSRQQMLNIMMNFGNRSNIDKFTQGWVKDKTLDARQRKVAATQVEMRLRMLFDRYATKQDWDYVQHIWDIFDEFKKEANDLAYRVSGVAPKWLPAESIRTPHGDYRGGYFPVIYDKLRSGIDVIKERPDNTDALFGKNYFRASTPHSYLAERTGYVDYVAFDNTIETVGARMQQMIHDISHREAVMNVSKIIYDKQIRNAIKNHYGVEYDKQLTPWLKDVANHFNLAEEANDFANWALRVPRMNLMIHALGLNLRVVLSPSLGTQGPLGIIGRAIYKQWDPQAKTEALAKSKEIPHTMRSLDRDYRELLESQITKQGLTAVQGTAARWAFYPMLKIEEGLRVNTWWKEYQRGLERGLEEADAVAVADSAVRERHGAAAMADLPAIMRSNEAMKLVTMFYGYFNTVYNWQRQLPGQVRRGDFKDAIGTMYGAVLVPAIFGALFFNQQKEGDSWFKTIAKAMALQPIQTIPFMREFANYFIEGHQPRSPLESVMTAIKAAATDVNNYMNRKPVKKPITHGANVIGLTTGMPLAQVGRTAQFASDVAEGKQRPRNIAEWVRGIVNGEARLKR